MRWFVSLLKRWLTWMWRRRLPGGTQLLLEEDGGVAQVSGWGVWPGLLMGAWPGRSCGKYFSSKAAASHPQPHCRLGPVLTAHPGGASAWLHVKKRRRHRRRIPLIIFCVHTSVSSAYRQLGSDGWGWPPAARLRLINRRPDVRPPVRRCVRSPAFAPQPHYLREARTRRARRSGETASR